MRRFYELITLRNKIFLEARFGSEDPLLGILASILRILLKCFFFSQNLSG